MVLGQNILAQNIKLIRICNGGNDNNLYWRNNADTCQQYGLIKIHATDAVGSAYFLLDQTTNNKNYKHINANVPSTMPWKYFLEYSKICGTDTLTEYSDTLIIDDQKPDSTILDSVSVDPITNKVYLGWSSNKTSDFSSYYLYNYDRPDPRLIENYKDTSYVDLTPPVNPKTKSLTYDITSSDSCDNRRDYGKYKHQTIYLQGKIDTCINEVNLNWTNYIGWPVIKYEVYKSANSSGYVFLDTTLAGVLSYKDNTNINPNSSYEYFVRAYNSNTIKVSSSSNSTFTLLSGKSINPKNTKIEVVTNNSLDNIEIQIKRNPNSNYQSIQLMRREGILSPVFIHSYSTSETIFEDVQANNIINYEYYIMSKNVCGVVTDTSSKSGNIVLGLTSNNGDNSLSWSKYFTWNGDVKDYTIYRSSGNKLSEATNFVAYLNKGTDTSHLEVGQTEAAVCYQITAQNNDGTLISKSNKVCNVRTGKIYYPNAIVPNGLNTNFSFIGEGIDLNKSKISIFNRWGQIEYSKEDISIGWDGRNNDKQNLPEGVYYFIANISQGIEMIEIHGNITILY